MSYSYKILVYDRNRQFDRTEYCKPMSLQFFANIEEVKIIIASSSSTTRYIVLLLDEPDAYHLIEINGNPNVVHVLNCNNSTVNMPKLRNVLGISENLRAYQAAFYSMNFYQVIAKVLNASGQEGLGRCFQEEAEKQFQWLINNIQELMCLILIIPLNTDRDNLTNFQCEMIQKCKNLFNDHEPIVRTLYDYILFEESDLGIIDWFDESDVISQRNYKDSVLKHLPKLAPIRIYLPANRDTIVCGLSRQLVARELNTNPDGARRYIDRCTFMEFEPVDPRYRENLAGYLGTRWQLDTSKTKPIRIEDIWRKQDFLCAIQEAYKTIVPLKDRIPLPLWMPDKNYYQTASNCSEYYQLTGEAQTGPSDENSDSEIDTSALPDGKITPPIYSDREPEWVEQPQIDQTNGDYDTEMDTCIQCPHQKPPPNG